MKGGKKKKPHGIKHKIREEKKREELIGSAFTVAILIVIIFVSGFFINSVLNQPTTSKTASSTSGLKAAIVDHLSLTRPNKTFIETATNILKQAGYSVDYYPGEKVTVEFYRNLPTHGYKAIILRVHSALNGYRPPVSLFTSEPYDKRKYVYEQLKDRLFINSYSEDERKKGTIYFGIPPPFIKHNMNGKFDNTLIISMGCNGLTYADMAKALTEKGAKVYIGWDGSILGTRNDPAITHLLHHLITEKQTVRTAVADTMKKFPPSPIDNSVLLYYPLEAGDKTIDDISGDD